MGYSQTCGGKQFKTRSLIWNVLVTLAITKKNNNKKIKPKQNHKHI